MSEASVNTGTLDVMKKSKTNFFYSSVFIPKEKREGLRTIYAYCRRTDDIADDGSVSTEERLKNLEEWENKLKSALDSGGTDSFFLELKKQIEVFSIPRKPFFDLIRGMEHDLEHREIKTFADLYDYCYCVASSVGLMSIEIFGYKNESIKNYAEKLGVALQLTNIMRDIDADLKEGRIYIPSEEMDRFGYSKQDLQNRVYNDNFRKLMEFQYERALGYYKEAEGSLPSGERKSMIPAMIMKTIYFGILKKIRKNDYNIFGRKISLTKFNKLLIALGIFLRYGFLR